MHQVSSPPYSITSQICIILIRIALLFERKNKERVVSVVGVNTTGRSIVIGEELATYDKVRISRSMLRRRKEKSG